MLIIKQTMMKKRKRETMRRWRRKSVDARDVDKNQKRRIKLPRYSKTKTRRKTLHHHRPSSNSLRKIRAILQKELKESFEKKKWLSRSLMKQINLKASTRLASKSMTNSS